MIAIRVNVSPEIGIGHLVRTSHIAKEFKLQGEETLFVLNKKDEVEPFLKDFFAVELYNEYCTIKETQDAKLTLSFIKDYDIHTVIVDSYDLNETWEKIISANGYKIVAIDDMQRKHCCDFIIDQKWTGINETCSRYNDLTPPNCTKLLGPEYTLLNPQYQYAESPDIKQSTVLFSLGGGGDLSIFNEIIKNLLDDKKLDINIWVILGPLSYNYHQIIAYKKTYANLKIIQNKNNLCPYYQKASLFIGALGASFYETSFFKIPVLSFSIAPNQESDVTYLQDYGHFLHIPLEEFCQSSKTVQLIKTLLFNINRLKHLRKNALINIDNKGIKRIVAAVKDNITISKNSTSPAPVQDYINLTPDIKLRKVTDRDINHYLTSRNLLKNRLNMNVNKVIPRIEHYNWWFSNKRKSYLVEKNQVKELYIWEEQVNYASKKFLIGGWFVCNENTFFDVSLLALQWQLETTRQKYSDATWIAIIKKTNHYVRTLNKYLGFVEVKQDEIEYNAIINCFNNPSNKEFVYVKKPV
ncbi:UDP-2,4-diacetamido-2,4,6-trideoxy-beta-L-altropyranose hydrolase [Desulfotignum phosphitoxidans]|uniref:Glycosyltransferase 28 domain-containing protein n=1 Tax=Desulfotignum phosphitoxidans DSM 13687 TaxID=1286635 RepID=S0G502_9BACT|nr:UDP-2,4-diacetamido-2,4,6-trideoxy-beta-L-altropyranose hydrolase [Desulfotignum phosphitoxidans]EMS79527.1 glycosyltransferase 28 domain-containing protein [Desulfotignum phosphitoxidans DSM 13687]